ncbi:MAG: family 10 glycosylhydrolase [Candidatus Delongbacteria bacterium]|nr:family 10 glycosylhydrolase [Candidatus Delongbacteria bacterium]
MKIYTWVHEDKTKSKEQWKDHFSFLKEGGFDTVFLGGNIEFIKEIAPIAKEIGLEIQAWFWTLNVNNDELVQKEHPEWFNVSRLGQSSLTDPPYVDYYKWLCPSRPEVTEYITENILKILEIDSISGIHLDYVRHPDQYLPEGLLKNYDLEDIYYPEFDFCYCETCREKFLKETGIDIKSESHIEHDDDWFEFRLRSVIDLVNHISEKVREKNKKITAAVFPTPDMASIMVRQDWARWNIDGAFPMLYNKFYNEDTIWIGDSLEECIEDTNGEISISAGLYLPEMKLSDFADALKYSINSGVAGISLFPSDKITKEHLEVRKTINN